MKIDGTFFKSFDMSDYPVDQQQLTLTFEDSIDTSDDVIYVPDVANTKSDLLSIPGWELKQIHCIRSCVSIKFGILPS
jgi:hypothetical protein